MSRGELPGRALGTWADGLTDEEIEERRRRAREWKAANAERHQANSAAYKLRHRDRLIARSAVASAIAAGRLHRQPCEVCGTETDVQAHHDDYTRKLEVRWLCRPHHNEADAQKRRHA